ncbi:MAG: 2-phospho-L-lactate transferase [Chloroflexi bacterium]|nr:MAG: 2-phospho-L-lactate transferase [Chloroflexota bacterium]
MSPRVALLAGGVGGAKLADGLYRALPQGELSIIANPGDDFELHGLTICPDHDTLLYTLAGLGDRERGWGLAGETWNALEQFGKIGAPDWFRLGDRDLALHIHRTALLKSGGRLTEVNRELQRRLGLPDAPILMATDDPLRTRVRTPEGWMEFQPWFVGAQAKPEVLEVEFVGAQRARVSAEVTEAILSAELIVIAPSNPLISIAPILAVDGVREAIASARTRGVQVIGVSPIVAGKAIKGPADRMLRAAGLPSSPVGVARALPGLFDTLLVEESDLTDALRAELAPLVPRVAGATTVMHDDDARLSLARQILQAASDAA